MKSLRLTATKLPRTRVTRSVRIAAELASLRGTVERRPQNPARLEEYEIRQDQQELRAIAEALRRRGR